MKNAEFNSTRAASKDNKVSNAGNGLPTLHSAPVVKADAVCLLLEKGCKIGV